MDDEYKQKVNISYFFLYTVKTAKICCWVKETVLFIMIDSATWHSRAAPCEKHMESACSIWLTSIYHESSKFMVSFACEFCTTYTTLFSF